MHDETLFKSSQDLTRGLLASSLNLVRIIKGCQYLKISMTVSKFTQTPDSLVGVNCQSFKFLNN